MFIVNTDITWKSHFCIIPSRRSGIQNCWHSMLSHPKSVFGSCRHIVNICWMSDHHWYESTVQRKGNIPKVNSVSFIWVGLRVILGSFLGGSAVKKNLAAMQKTRKSPGFWSLGQEDPLEEGMATHSSILALESPVDRGAWQATVHSVAQRLAQPKQLSTTHARRSDFYSIVSTFIFVSMFPVVIT